MRSKNTRFATTFPLLVLLSGCTDQNEFNALDARVKAIESQSASLEEKIKTLQRKTELNELFQNLDATAYLQPSDQGYALIRSDLGIMTIKLTDVRPYANGSRVTLQFGNISGAAINGLKAKIEWGKVNKNGLPEIGSEKSREITFEKKLRASAWTNVPLVLDGIPPAQLGYVRVTEVGHRGIELTR